eukprot:1943837-Prymnesium_polylepis.1
MSSAPFLDEPMRAFRSLVSTADKVRADQVCARLAEGTQPRARQSVQPRVRAGAWCAGVCTIVWWLSRAGGASAHLPMSSTATAGNRRASRASGCRAPTNPPEGRGPRPKNALDAGELAAKMRGAGKGRRLGLDSPQVEGQARCVGPGAAVWRAPPWSGPWTG